MGLDLRWYREFRFKPARKEKSPCVVVSFDSFNVLNWTNYQNFIGALSSPFLGQAVATLHAWRLQLAHDFSSEEQTVIAAKNGSSAGRLYGPAPGVY